MTKIFLAPHNDDETLFGAFTIMRDRPIVCVVFDSFVQAGVDPRAGAVERRQESIDAIAELTSGGLYGPRPVDVLFAGLNDNGNYDVGAVALNILRKVQIGGDVEIFAPAHEEGGHDQHNLVSMAALWIREAYGASVTVTHYATYVRGKGKTRTEKPVAIADGDWIARKHRALACYKSQYMNAALGCRPWFEDDLKEYYL